MSRALSGARSMSGDGTMTGDGTGAVGEIAPRAPFSPGQGLLPPQMCLYRGQFGCLARARSAWRPWPDARSWGRWVEPVTTCRITLRISSKSGLRFKQWRISHENRIISEKDQIG